MDFYRCKESGAVFTNLNGVVECGLEKLTANTVDAATEKHVPVYTVEGQKVHVKVGDVAHPMTEAHLIEFIALETKTGVQFKELTAADAPEATFTLNDGDEVVAVYEYCNLHGLWKA